MPRIQRNGLHIHCIHVVLLNWSYVQGARVTGVGRACILADNSTADRRPVLLSCFRVFPVLLLLVQLGDVSEVRAITEGMVCFVENILSSQQ